MTTKRKAPVKRKTKAQKKLTAQVRFGVLMLLLVVLTAGAVVGEVWAWNNTFAFQVVRDAVIAVVAHYNAGPDIPIDIGPYSGSSSQSPEKAWGMLSNSLWLVRQTARIVPQLVYEDVGAGLYPDTVIFVPYPAYRSLQVAGTMSCTYEYGCLVMLNERFLTDPGWDDMRALLATLVHEIIHRQGGLFIDDPNVSDWPTKSAHLESKTSAATLEVLAAMCNDRDPLACRAFWVELESMARGDVKYRLRSAPWLYEGFANLFLRDGQDERAARKRVRYWSGHEEDMYTILLKYQLDPYESFVLPGLKYGLPLSTGVLVYDEIDNQGNWVQAHYSNMQFDDVYDLLGPWAWLWMNVLTH